MATRGRGIRSSAQDNFIGPNNVTGVTATDVGTSRAFNNGAITVSWTNPASGNTPTGYKVYDGATLKATISHPTSTTTITGLVGGTSYTYTVKSYDSYGEASGASATATATTVPGTPGTPTVSTVANQSIDVVTWTAPNTGGSAISAYYWTSSDGKSGSTASTSVNVTQEAGTAQTYNVYAANANGNGLTSANSSSFTSFSFSPFGFTPFGFTPFGFTPFAPFGFTPFGFTPFSPSFSEYSIASATGVLTKDGRKEAQHLQVGDKIYALDLGQDANVDWLSWSLDNSELDMTKLVETEVVSITSRKVNKIYVVNGDVFSGSHLILSKKDNIVKFIRSSEIDTTYEIYSYDNQSWKPVTLVEEVDYEETVYSINCEPYDNFFSDNMLVFDSKDSL